MLFAYDQTLSLLAEVDVLRTSLNWQEATLPLASRPKAALRTVI